MNNLQLSLFRGVHDTQPRPVTLMELVTMMRTDQSVRDLTEKHRYARTMGDEQGAKRYKHMMASFGVAARFEGGRQQKHIVEHTGLSLVDIDHIAEEDMARVLDLVRADEHTLLAYTTLSGKGVRVLFRYKTPSNLPLYGEALQTSLQNNSCEHPEGAPHRGGAVQRTEGVCRGQNLALFHLIVQMQREGQIHFTQLIAEKGYRWLHISYVPGMLRNQVIDVNDDSTLTSTSKKSKSTSKKDYQDSG